MLSNTIVKLLAVFVFATPAVLIGGQVYSLLQPNTSLWQGFLKIYSVLYIIPGMLHASRMSTAMQPAFSRMQMEA